MNVCLMFNLLARRDKSRITRQKIIRWTFGSLMAMLSIVVVSSGAASMVGIGVEDMPKSLKDKR